jgi:flagellin-specific chaperone FliS
MLALQNPREAYRRVAFDARIAGSGHGELIAVCFEQLDMALGDALHAALLGDNHRKSSALTRALSAVTALQLGIDARHPFAPVLGTFYEGIRKVLLDSALQFNARALDGVRRDFGEIREAMASTMPMAS